MVILLKLWGFGNGRMQKEKFENLELQKIRRHETGFYEGVKGYLQN